MIKVQQRRCQLWASKVFLPIFSMLFFFMMHNVEVTTAGSNEPSERTETNNQQSTDELISSAIDACWDKLSHSDHTVAPYAFPKTRRRLALLLQSRLPAGDVMEIANLFASSAQNVTAPFHLAASERADSFLRAADVMMEYGAELADVIAEEEAEAFLRGALSVRNSQDKQEENEGDAAHLSQAHATVFEKLIHLILRKFDSAGNSSKESAEQILRSALELCDQTSKLCPDEPVVDEYRGAVIRKLYGTRSMRHKKGEAFVVSSDGMTMTKNSGPPSFGILGPRSSTEVASGPVTAPQLVEAADSVYGSYASAAAKSHTAAISGVLGITLEGARESYPYGFLPSLEKLSTALGSRDDNELNIISQLWSRLVQHIILAVAAAREASLTAAEDEHLAYGLKILSTAPLSGILPPDIKADMFVNAGITQKSRGRIDEAIQLFREALHVNPGDGHATVQLASLGSDGAVSATSLSDDYVAGLFDGYSDRFEKELVDELGYRGHEFVADAVIRHGGMKRNEKSYTCVDLGCGTGLAGNILRQKVDKDVELNLIGVDLSSRMAEQSRARLVGGDNGSKHVYDNVRAMDGNEFLASLPEGSVDAILSSDVFIYVGELTKIFHECVRVLKTGGILSFTVELPSKNEEAAAHVKEHGMALLKSGRFGHSRKYVEKIAKKGGFKMIEWKNNVLRKQGKEDVPGALVVLRKK